MKKPGSLIIFSAPSGAGKTTLVRRLLAENPQMEFSISCCTRAPRHNEVHGKDYYFITPQEFREKIQAGEFVEWEEVYKDHLYGTLHSEVERIRQSGNHVVFDIDVQGGINLKKQFGEEALALFIKPPSVEELRRRLEIRKSDSQDKINLRVEKALHEMSFADNFDHIIINDDLEKAVEQTELAVKNFCSD
ncbi:MAG: guanylate kinase [Weeksellaceae bacterium]|nr:guanylate kinase [Weeksellaceae bacterium]